MYFSCKSGARIGLVEELRPLTPVALKDESAPSQGFNSLHLKPDDFAKLPDGSVIVPKETVAGEKHMAVDVAVGMVHGIGVEHLRGSGMIAGETSRAYAETFTLSHVSGRSVGTGAYVNRRGQCNFQMHAGSMVLLGFAAEICELQLWAGRRLLR